MLAIATAFTLAAAPAGAATYTLNLSGSVANTTTNSFTYNGSIYYTGALVLDAFAPFTVVAGDVIEGRLTLDGPFTVPAAGEQFFGLNFQAADGSQPIGPDGSSNADGTLNFSNSMGMTGLANNSLGGSCGNCLAVIIGRIPGSSFSFDGLTYSATITGLDQPFDLGQASISYQDRDLLAAVPEPASWALLIGGMGFVGFAGRRKGATRAVLA
jgi:hypothetical protein